MSDMSPHPRIITAHRQIARSYNWEAASVYPAPAHHTAAASLAKWSNRLNVFVVIATICLFTYHAARHFGVIG